MKEEKGKVYSIWNTSKYPHTSEEHIVLHCFGHTDAYLGIEQLTGTQATGRRTIDPFLLKPYVRNKAEKSLNFSRDTDI